MDTEFVETSYARFCRVGDTGGHLGVFQNCATFLDSLLSSKGLMDDVYG